MAEEAQDAYEGSEIRAMPQNALDHDVTRSQDVPGSWENQGRWTVPKKMWKSLRMGARNQAKT